MTLPAGLSAALDALFADHPLIGHAAAARLLNVCARTLRRMGDDGTIDYRLRGKRSRQYAREDLEAYLKGKPCLSICRGTRSAGRNPASTNTTSASRRRANANLVDFTAALAKEREKKRSKSSRR